jgi:hypothetical protein
MTLLDERIGALSHAVRHGLPTVENVALEVGESAASAGLSLREVFDRVAHLGDASHEETPRTDMAALSQTISLGWSDATEKFLLSMSCEDPVTGLATPAYLHVRLESLYRAAVRDDVAMSARHALVVVELPPNRSPLDLDLSMLEASEILRMVFTGDEVFARVHRRRIAVLVNRIDGDPLTVALISRLLARHPVAQPSRLWLEELPASVDQLPWTLGGLSSPP